MNRKLSMGVALAALLAASPAFAADDAVLKQLKAMQTQMEKLQKEVGTLKKELAAAKSDATEAQVTATKAQATAQKAEAKAAPATVVRSGEKASGSDVKITMNPAPKFETADGEYSFKVGGFAQVDAGAFSDDVRDHPDGTNIRRARFNVTGTIAKDWKYKLENDFAGNTSAITDAYLEYTGLDSVTLTAGQFKEPFGLETLTSDLFTTFMERASLVAFAPDRNIGFQVMANDKSSIGAWTAAAGFFGSGTGVASTDDESNDLTGRVTLAPLAEKDEVIHLGLAGSRRTPDSATSSYRVQSRSENRLDSAQAVDTGSIANVDHTDLLGLEAAAVWGPASIQGEYMVSDVSRENGFQDVSFDGYYVEASYFLTGESRNYVAKQGKFDRVTPKDPFSISEGGTGAWQVSARYSELDLNDAPVNGGELKDITLGVRWYPQANLSLTANYINVNTDATAVTANDDPEIYLVRAQYDF